MGEGGGQEGLKGRRRGEVEDGLWFVRELAQALRWAAQRGKEREMRGARMGGCGTHTEGFGCVAVVGHLLPGSLLRGVLRGERVAAHCCALKM